ncbi:hypothetical protein ES703_126095 [subsurface metagenome]
MTGSFNAAHSVQANGSWLITTPDGTPESLVMATVPTVKPCSIRLASAAVCSMPTTLGMSCGGAALLTRNSICRPATPGLPDHAGESMTSMLPSKRFNADA